MNKSLICFPIIFTLFLVFSLDSHGEQESGAKEWREYIATLAPMGEAAKLLAEPGDDHLRMELYKDLFSQIASGYFSQLHASAKNPEFWPYLNHVFNTLGPNPDNVYYVTPVDGQGIYRITGFRGSVRLVYFQVGGGTFVTKGTGDNLGDTLANFDIDTLNISPDGQFEVILSQARPQDYTGDWWQLSPDASYLLVRQTAYDWLHEVDARIAIERLDTPAIRPRQSAEEIDQQLKQIATWARAHVEWSARVIKRWRDQGEVNQLQFIDFSKDGALGSQKYLEGHFEIAPDEALILETDVPESCRYWSFQLTDLLWRSIDWANRQTNLNGFTAKQDSDGKFRAVITAGDPGVPNWLDTAGYKRGIVQGRWDNCTSYPMPELKKVKLSELRDYLPADTPTVTGAEREETIRARSRGVQLRKKW